MVPVPDYLPVLFVSRTDRTRKKQVLSALILRLQSAGIRVMRLEDTQGSRGGILTRERLYEAAAGCELIIISGGREAMTGANAVLSLGSESLSFEGNVSSPCLFHCPGESEIDGCSEDIISWLNVCERRTPVCGCILIGGESRRMGRPKHLLPGKGGRSWLEQTVEILSSEVDDLVISGAGSVPETLDRLERIEDLSGIEGPLAGIAAVVRSGRLVSWLVVACDMPDISKAGIRWLLDQRRPGAAAVIPRNGESGRSEPLFAFYGFRSGPLIGEMLAGGERRMSRIRDSKLVFEPAIPADLCGGWKNVNRPEEI